LQPVKTGGKGEEFYDTQDVLLFGGKNLPTFT